MGTGRSAPVKRVFRPASFVLAAAALAGCGLPGPTVGGGAGRPAVGATTSAPSASTRSTPGATGRDSVRALPRLVDRAAWVERDGVQALKVAPSQTLRDASDPAVFDEAWRRVIVAIPAADRPGLKDQFVCHATFASSKSAWYLEPSRPDVGYWKTVQARCNPGDVRDIG